MNKRNRLLTLQSRAYRAIQIGLLIAQKVTNEINSLAHLWRVVR